MKTEELLGIRKDGDTSGGKAKTRGIMYEEAGDGKENCKTDLKLEFLIYCVSSVK